MNTLPTSCSRRSFLAASALAVAGGPGLLRAADAAPPRLKLCLSPGSIGVNAGQDEAIELAIRHGFEAVEPFPQHLAGLSSDALGALTARLRERGLTWGAAGLPVEFRRDDATFRTGLEKLPPLAAALQRAGAERVGTWLSPASGSLTYVQNFRQHAARLREVAGVLGGHGLRLGLEYVGTYTLRARSKFPFVHCLAEARELIAEIGRDNVGLVLDAWHWWQADDTEADLLTLRASDVVSVDLNDAPAGVPKREQQDGRRELPAATGGIDVVPFLRALEQIGYDGPARAEPFNKPLNDLDNEAACAATIAALRKARGRLTTG